MAPSPAAAAAPSGSNNNNGNNGGDPPAAPTEFSVVVHLPPGYHQYKFIVDGAWRHDDSAPFMPDPLGNVNNWLFVRRAEGGAGGGGSAAGGVGALASSFTAGAAGAAAGSGAAAWLVPIYWPELTTD